MFPDYFQYIKGSDITFKEIINVALARKILTLCLHAYEMGNILSFIKSQGKYEPKKYVANNILGTAMPGKLLYLRVNRLTNSCKV